MVLISWSKIWKFSKEQGGYSAGDSFIFLWGSKKASEKSILKRGNFGITRLMTSVFIRSGDDKTDRLLFMFDIEEGYKLQSSFSSILKIAEVGKQQAIFCQMARFEKLEFFKGKKRIVYRWDGKQISKEEYPKRITHPDVSMTRDSDSPKRPRLGKKSLRLAEDIPTTGKGNHIRVCRGVYYHHGIDMGDGTVIHYSNDSILDGLIDSILGTGSTAVQRVSMAAFLDGGKVEIVEYSERYDSDEICRRARENLGERKYKILGNNCEHFARGCSAGKRRSDQANAVEGVIGGTLGTGIATKTGLALVSATGATAGMSGAGIMSGLASVGSVVGGGAAAGVAALAAAPAVIGAGAASLILEDDKSLSKSERKARKAGRTAAVAGGAIATAGTVGAISAAGTVAGLSGAGITSGLAAIGGTVGGGMATGTAIVVAAPAAAAVTVSYAAYKLWKWISK